MWSCCRAFQLFIVVQVSPRAHAKTHLTPASPLHIALALLLPVQRSTYCWLALFLTWYAIFLYFVLCTCHCFKLCRVKIWNSVQSCIVFATLFMPARTQPFWTSATRYNDLVLFARAVIPARPHPSPSPSHHFRNHTTASTSHHSSLLNANARHYLSPLFPMLVTARHCSCQCPSLSVIFHSPTSCPTTLTINIVTHCNVMCGYFFCLFQPESIWGRIFF